MSSFNQYTFTPAFANDWLDISILEKASYPADEAATDEKIQYRIQAANAYFYVLKNSEGKIVGFINGTCISSVEIHHDSMSHHEDGGRTLVIHSVVINADHRRHKLASFMMEKYLLALLENKLCDRVLLLAKAYLLQFYLQCGFKVIRLSPVVHGEDKWFELGLELREHFGHEQLQVDAFVPGGAFTGNPAGVVFVHKDEVWMQNVAMENNLAETSFLEKVSNGNYKLRWFTPAKEVELCGHATLAAAHALYESGREPLGGVISFHTLYSGVLTAVGHKDGSISLSFPATPVSPYILSDFDKEKLHTALGIREEDVVFAGKSIYDTFIEISPEAFDQLTSIAYSVFEHFGGRGVIVTAKGAGQEHRSAGCHFRSRCFFPIYGINEDPVTGSAHCALAPYWLEKLGMNEGEEMKAFQASPRGGLLLLRLTDNKTRVSLTGYGITTMKTIILA